MQNNETLNKFLVETFHKVLKVQEESIKKGEFKDLSLNKMHVLEEIALNQPITMTLLAQKLSVTLGTLTVAVENLVKKGYVKRVRNEKDRRIVNLCLEEKGQKASSEHAKFHKQMISVIEKSLNEDEVVAFCKGLEALTEYFSAKKGVKMRIITDSTCDLDFKFLEENNVSVVKLNYFFGEEEFTDGVSQTRGEFYEKLQTSDTLPTTSQPSPEQFAEVFEKYINQGETVLGIFLSSELSGTFQSASIAKEIVGSDKIHLVDSRAVTLCLSSLILEAIKLRNDGLSVIEIIKELENMKETNELIAVVGTLKYLQMGGRLSKTSATIGSILNMKPIIKIEDGKVLAAGKARGEKGAYEKVLEMLIENPIDTNYPVIFGHSNSPDLMANFENYLRDNGITLGEVRYMEIGTVIGVHVGPGAVAISYQIKK